MHGQKILKNTFFSIGSKFIVLVLSFITRKIFLDYLGAELLGLSSVYTNILDLLNMSEFGISNAIQFRLYKPLAEKNYREINNLLYYTRRIFMCIGLFILVLGAILSLFIENLVGVTEYDINLVRVSFFIGVINISASYLFTHRRLLLQTNEELYIVNIADTLMNAIFAATKIISIIVFRNFILYLALGVVQTLGANVLISLLCKKNHPEIQEVGYDNSVTKGVLADFKYVMPQKISWFVYRSTDNLVITKILGLLSVAAYSNYMMVVSNIVVVYSQIIGIINSSFGILKNEIGNLGEFRRKVKQLEFINFVIGSVISVELFCLLDSLIFLWLGEQYVLNKLIVVLLSIDFFFFSSYQPLSIIFNITGKFKDDYKITLFIAIANVTISIALAFLIGIPGVIIGTLFCDISSFLLRSKRIAFELFDDNKMDYTKFWIRNIVTTGIAAVICTVVSMMILQNITWITLVIAGLCNLFVLLVVLFLFNYQRDYCKDTIILIRDKLFMK